MSMPSCMRPQRQPKPLVIGPLTGQIRPLEERSVPARADSQPGAPGSGRRWRRSPPASSRDPLRPSRAAFDGHAGGSACCPRGREGVLPHEESVAGGALLLGLLARERRSPRPRRLRRGRHHAWRGASRSESRLRWSAICLSCSPIVAEVVELLEQVGEGCWPGGGSRARSVSSRLVELDEARLEPARARLRAVASQQVVALRLLACTCPGGASRRRGGGEVALERGEPVAERRRCLPRARRSARTRPRSPW